MKRYAIRYVEKRFDIDKMKNVVLKGHIQDAFFRTPKERIAYIAKNKMYAYQYGKVIDGDIFSVVWDKYFIIKMGKVTRLAPIQFNDRLYYVEVNTKGAFITMDRFRSRQWTTETSATELNVFLQEKKLNWIDKPVQAVADWALKHSIRPELLETISEAVEVMCEV